MSQPSLISIIIPVLNAKKYIGPCLDALLAQDYPKNRFEIMVLDNGSSDGTVDIVKKYPVKVFIKTECNISALRNWGVTQANGDIFAFIDADCIAPKDWLTEACALLRLDNVGAAGCWYALPDSTTLIERTWDILTSIRRGKIGPIDWVPSGDLVIRKEVFEQVQGFDEYLITSEDVDICQRIIKTGKTVYSHPKIAVKHLGNTKTLKQFFLKEKWRGEGVLQNSFRKFPHIEINNALLFGVTSFLFVCGILGGTLLWTISNDKCLFSISILGLLIVPLLMTIKTLSKSPQWCKFFILLLLFTVYGLARASSVLSPKVWKNS